jgi:hypothetical protein
MREQENEEKRKNRFAVKQHINNKNNNSNLNFFALKGLPFQFMIGCIPFTSLLCCSYFLSSVRRLSCRHFLTTVLLH